MAFKVKSNAGVCEWSSLPNKTTTVDSYEDVGIWTVGWFKTKIFKFTVTTNTLKINVLGSIDGGATFDQTIEADIVQVVGSVVKTYTGLYTHIKIQVKPNVSATNGTLATKYFGSIF